MIILGIDPGVADIGYAIVKKDNKIKLESCGLIQVHGCSQNQRLCRIFEELSFIIDKYNPDACSIEKIFYFKNQKTVMDVSEGRGVIKLVLSRKNIQYREYTPKEVKRLISGNGLANKDQVRRSVEYILGSNFNNLQDDVTDAIALALIYSDDDSIYSR
ncbi:Crossover junction endodeoxyribonuclease ruvC [Thermodesulfobium narugense DSM 14796]|uniref:Crossover junction endodeoxyribonuclease RuvC n=1 Tax=Thermodesulfobium narugense DSM 14796 TaxID=747365 RepID=M1E4T5_9BACT|nr:crossover junction endodeoxyribonuclease RuvC [Thermodesulfobium narugense]AEE14517.1 Crossover junction endodeoxyribonuclease ruvC [Thermodesulfobium narugense DSM 14796]